jgi:hypothetical protein
MVRRIHVQNQRLPEVVPMSVWQPLNSLPRNFVRTQINVKIYAAITIIESPIKTWNLGG